ncbi:MAG TPA: flagellin [Bryobacteraceae bacterium]|nr:flagellin [Bryobacteraceae bacterium]
MISIQTNIDSLIAQQNLSVNSQFQSNTIQQLTSGYRINSSADDAAGLAVANGYRNQIAELNQGVLNANQGVSQLQILDGGLSNISQMLDRMKTLATESASQTFTGDRTTLNNEYTQLVSEITRQAANVGLNSGGNFNTDLSVYIGGGSISTQNGSSSVDINLSGGSNAVDAASLGLSGTDVLGGTVGGVEFSGNTERLDNPATSFLANSTQTYTFNYTDASGATQSRAVVVSGGSSGVDGTDVITQLNNGLNGTGISASINATDGTVQFTSSGAFAAGVAAVNGVGQSTVTSAATLVNTSQYNATQAFTGFVDSSTGGTAASETFTLSDANNSATITLDSSHADTLSDAVTYINQQLQAAGINDVSALATGDNSTGISFQGASNFSIVESAYTAGTGTSTGALFGATGDQTVTGATSGGTAGSDAQAAITAINNAVAQLGLVQGVVGAGENKLNYAINLAQSQITSFSSAQSQIRDANVAAEAANLTKSQVLEQASIAAMAQANQEPQAILSLLKQ